MLLIALVAIMMIANSDAGGVTSKLQITVRQSIEGLQNVNYPVLNPALTVLPSMFDSCTTLFEIYFRFSSP